MVSDLPGTPPPELPLPAELAQFRTWRPEAQQRALELLQEREHTAWRPFYCKNRHCDGNPHDDWVWQHARADQRPPPWSERWLVWLLKGGRGSGKTRTGSECTHRVTKVVSRMYLIAPTSYDLRETMVEGISGVLATAPPGGRPKWEPSKKKLTWPNGCIAQGFSAEEPDRLRGPAAGFVWADEPAHWPLVEECWSNMQFGLRVKGHPTKIIATSTPKPIRWMKDLIADPKTITHTVSTYENLVNLSDSFRDLILERHEGTRLGRQELHGEVLEDVEGALWQWEMIKWVEDAPAQLKIVVAVDPAGTANKRSDETGIIVLGMGHDKNFYVFEDASGKFSPGVWGAKVNALYDEHQANSIIAERNFGEDMVRYVMENSGFKGADIKMVRSRRGKDIRAEPIVALYEKGKVFHVGKRGALAGLEEEMTSWVPGQGASPNRVDALVHGMTAIAKIAQPAVITNPNQVLGHLDQPGQRRLRIV